MEEKRKFQRFPLELHAMCMGDETQEDLHCKVTQISRQGLAVKLLLNEKVAIGPSLKLEIDIPIRIEPVHAVVHLKWIKESNCAEGYSYMAGGELQMIKPEDKAYLLDYGYENWKRNYEEA